MRACSIIACYCLFAPSLAAAQSFQGPCKTQVLCKGIEPGGGRLIDCLREHKRDLTTACRLAIADFFLNRPRQARGGRGAGQSGPPERHGPDERGAAPGRDGPYRGGPDERAAPDGQGPDGRGPDDRRGPGPRDPDLGDPEAR